MTVPRSPSAAGPEPAPRGVHARSHRTVPPDVDRVPLLTIWPTAICEVTGTGSSLVAGRPGGYKAGAEDATTAPSAAMATTAVTAWPPGTGPVIAGTASVPSSAGWTRAGSAGWTGPGLAGWLRWPSTVPAGTPPG